MNLREQVLAQFDGFPFGAPVTQEELQRAERELGEALPPWMRDLYLAFDGFRGPTNAHFFWPLFGANGLVGFNAFLRAGAEFPHEFVSSCLFFGDDGTGSMWGLKHDRPGEIILWDASWGEDFEVAGASPLEVWSRSKLEYEDIPAEPVA